MNKIDGLKIGLALNHIAMSVSDGVLKTIKPHLETIEKIVLADINAAEGGEESEHRTDD